MIKKCALMLLVLAIIYSEAKFIDPDSSNEATPTTICPEEELNTTNNTNLNLQNKTPTESDDLNRDNEATTISSEIPTTIGPSKEEETELPSKSIAEKLENILEDLEEIVTEDLEESSTTTEEPTTEIPEEISTTTICPEELAKLTVKNILTFQKDSALYKLVKDKLNLKRAKRQVQYYANQPAYGKVKTYQQIRRQNAKPVISNFNQKSYVSRYPNNNNRKYYRNKAANRRKFAVASSTTARPTRAVFKKKFRPSPVFA